MEQEKSNRDHAREQKQKQSDTASEAREYGKEDSLTDTQTTLCSLSETLQMTTLPSSPCP